MREHPRHHVIRKCSRYRKVARVSGAATAWRKGFALLSGAWPLPYALGQVMACRGAKIQGEQFKGSDPLKSGVTEFKRSDPLKFRPLEIPDKEGSRKPSPSCGGFFAGYDNRPRCSARLTLILREVRKVRPDCIRSVQTDTGKMLEGIEPLVDEKIEAAHDRDSSGSERVNE